METTDAEPNEVWKWFQEGNHSYEILCFFIGVEVRHQALLEALIKEVVAIDTVLGEAIALVVFRPSNQTSFTVLPAIRRDGQRKQPVLGELVKRSAARMEPLEGAQYDNEEVRRKLVERTARFAGELSRWVTPVGGDITLPPLPALYIFVRGHSEGKIISFTEKATLDTLKKWLEELSRIAQQQYAGYDPLYLSRRLQQMEKTIGTLESLFAKHLEQKRTLGKGLEALCVRNKASEDDRALASQFAANLNVSTQSFDQMIERLSFAGWVRGTKRLRLLIEKMEACQAEIEMIAQSQAHLPQLDAEQLRQRREQLVRAISELPDSVSSWSFQVPEGSLTLIDKVLSVAGKLAKHLGRTAANAHGVPV